MKFDIKSRWTGEVIFAAEIEASEGDEYGLKLGLAVRAAAKAGANLARADLADANLAGADLADANLAGANLARANLADADLVDAYLVRANLAGANLAGADLARANLADADLNGVSGLNQYVMCIQVEDWPIAYMSDVMQIGCQRHPIDAWRTFNDAEIRVMDGMKALNFWSKWKAWIFQAIEMAPAKPTNADQSESAQ